MRTYAVHSSTRGDRTPGARDERGPHALAPRGRRRETQPALTPGVFAAAVRGCRRADKSYRGSRTWPAYQRTNGFRQWMFRMFGKVRKSAVSRGWSRGGLDLRDGFRRASLAARRPRQVSHAAQMFPDVDNFRNREPLADSIERQAGRQRCAGWRGPPDAPGFVYGCQCERRPQPPDSSAPRQR